MTNHTALVIVDVQANALAHLADSAGVVAALGTAIAAAREASVPVLFVGMAFRPEAPEVSPQNSGITAWAADGANRIGDPAVAFPTELTPAAGDVVLTKSRGSAFEGTDLGIILRSQGITDLVIAGTITGGGVTSTVRQASDLDYRLTVLSDGCADPDADLHRALVEKLFPRQAEVLTTAEWAAGLTR
ncbi:cysteine hydrolase [Granulicoccus phenolivorans]|uniref:cysteine hydrolase n=1 Tax=Granulicoccus phenolivorans TaxID=266854 RepID=UPI0003FFEC23|nr:cysteine hydrolase [Granulicoccus phenolivorans]